MITYIVAFIFYTLAMIGVLLGGFVIYKKAILPMQNQRQGNMKVIDSLAIAPKKNLLIVKVEDRRFLIASGAEHTTFLADLGVEKNMEKIKENVNYIKEKAFEKEMKENSTSSVIRQFEKLNRPKSQQESENKIITIKDENTTLIPKKEMIRRLLNNLKEENREYKY